VKRKIATMTLALVLTAGVGNVYANSDVTEPNTVTNNDEVLTTVVSLKEIENSAGVLPDSNFYSLERQIEELQIAITKSDEKLAKLMSQFATERAAEAAVMANQGEGELQNKATAEYAQMLSSATKHINNAIKAKGEAVQTLENLNESYKKSEEILNTILDTVPDEAKGAIQKALDNQNKEIATVNGFYAGKDAFFAIKKELEKAKQELEATKKTGDSEAIAKAEQKVKEAEALKDELEKLKDAADFQKEEVKHLVEQAKKSIKSGFKQVDKANEIMQKVEEKALENQKRTNEKSIEEMKKAEEKAREEVKKAEEKAREETKKALEQGRK